MFSLLLERVAVLVLCFSAIHSLRYFYIATPGIPAFPEFVAVGMVDGVTVCYYDSSTQRMVPMQRWMADNLDQRYWEEETSLARMAEQALKADIEILKLRFNQSDGVHVFQRMYGCHYDDGKATSGSEQYGYEGADFISLDLDNMRWVAAVLQAVPTKLKWDRFDSQIQGRKDYFTHECTDWLKKYVQYGSSTLGRKVPPEVSVFLSSSSSSPVVCHATGFYPDRVMITWKRDGAEMQEDVDVGETLPNGDGTFQKRVVLTVSPEEREKFRFTCEVAHQSGEPIIRTLTEVNESIHL
ncbi:class I histocompatibility antigen, F10 alpha chain-like [Sardina pilchardus]|uniref:class I histocompatibility antigen, F10 alpha chain-like n=1 Tax=Sardina pilchardus TaxID=27697 RepID=UPI002E112BB8